jgi:16S rRNA (cytosine967-C5)-methyltransferase
MTAREISARVLSDVLRNKTYLDKALNDHLGPVSDRREMRLAQELSYGVMRWYHQLDFICNRLLKKALKDRESEILALILMGLYQLKYLRIPDHAAISATVQAANELGKPWAKDLINAVLRRYQREQDFIEQQVAQSVVASYSHPKWLIEKFQKQWPKHWRLILTSNNCYPPLHMRLDLSKFTRENYTHLLQEKGLEYITSKYVKTGIGLVKPVAVEEIPGFKEGYVSIQDFGAQLAAPLLDCPAGARVLDACAAPGGKTTHILELAADLQELVAVDISAERLKRLKNSLRRLDKTARIIEADISGSPEWWDGNQFDRILLDAPCSASGVIRRHPDIKFTRTAEQLSSLVSRQYELLSGAWPLLKTEGKLLFCTCSIFSEESDDQIAKFTGQYNNAETVPIYVDWGVKSRFGRHTIPGHDESDGFYYSIIIKKP